VVVAENTQTTEEPIEEPEKKTLTVDDLELSEEKKKELEAKDEEPVEPDAKTQISDYHRKQQEKREARLAYRKMGHQEKIDYIKDKYSYDELAKRFVQNDEIVPGKDRTITTLKTQLRGFENTNAELDSIRKIAVGYQKELEALKAEKQKAPEIAPQDDFVEKYSRENEYGERINDPEFLKAIEDKIKAVPKGGDTSVLEKQIKDLQEQNKVATIKGKERDFRFNFTRAVPDSAKILNGEIYKEIYSSPITNLDENLSSYLINQLGMNGAWTTGQVIETLHNSSDMTIMPALKSIFDYVRSIENQSLENKPSKKDKLKTQIHASTNRGGARPEKTVGKTYSPSFLDEANKALTRGTISVKEHKEKLAEYEKAFLEGRVI